MKGAYPNFEMYLCKGASGILGGAFNDVSFLPLPGEIIQFD